MSKKKVAAIIEARMGSSRLPGKVLMEILGKPTLQWMVERLQKAKQLDDIIIATTTEPRDSAIVQLAEKLNVSCFRGSEDDVLDRVLQAARSFDVDVIVETTGDCTLMDPIVVDKIIREYKLGDSDYVSNILHRTYPDGMDCQVFSTDVLEQVSYLTDDPADREHVSLYIYHHPERFSLRNVKSELPEKYWRLRMVLDTPDDFRLIKTVFEALAPEGGHFSLDILLAYLDENPDVMAMCNKPAKT